MTRKVSIRDRIAWGICTWVLNHIATEWYRRWIDGAIHLGMMSAMENELSGEDLGNLAESLRQLARDETGAAGG